MSQDSTQAKSVRLCSFPGCCLAHKGHGLCRGHLDQRNRGLELRPMYSTQRKRGTDPCTDYDEIACHFLETPCHFGRTAKNKKGYGIVRLNGKTVLLHRFVYQKNRGVIPDNLLVLHKCDNPPCINIDHLFLGTNDDNMADMARKGRNATKVTNIDVLEIRKRRSSGESLLAIAKDFGITEGHVSEIFTGKKRAHVSLTEEPINGNYLRK